MHILFWIKVAIYFEMRIELISIKKGLTYFDFPNFCASGHEKAGPRARLGQDFHWKVKSCTWRSGWETLDGWIYDIINYMNIVYIHQIYTIDIWVCSFVWAASKECCVLLGGSDHKQSGYEAPSSQDTDMNADTRVGLSDTQDSADFLYGFPLDVGWHLMPSNWTVHMRLRCVLEMHPQNMPELPRSLRLQEFEVLCLPLDCWYCWMKTRAWLTWDLLSRQIRVSIMNVDNIKVYKDFGQRNATTLGVVSIYALTIFKWT